MYIKKKIHDAWRSRILTSERRIYYSLPMDEGANLCIGTLFVRYLMGAQFRPLGGSKSEIGF